MKSIPFLSLAALLFGGSVVAQTPAPAFYAESFRKTPIRVAEDKFEVKLTADNSTYKQRIRDSSGGERFELTMTPRRPQGGANNQITSWEIEPRPPNHAALIVKVATPMGWNTARC